MQSRELNIIEKWKRNHQGSSWTSRDCPHISSAAIAGNHFIVAQIRRGAVHLFSLAYQWCRYFISSFFFSPLASHFWFPTLSFAVALETQNCSFSPAFSSLSFTFHFSLSFSFSARCIEAKLLLMFVGTGVRLSLPMHRDVQTRFEPHSHEKRARSSACAHTRWE